MKLPAAKDHVEGSYQVAVFIRRPKGDSIAFTSTGPLSPDDPIVKAAREAIAAALRIDAEDV